MNNDNKQNLTAASHERFPIVFPSVSKQKEEEINNSIKKIIADSKSKDQTDAILANYLWEQGMEDASMMAELFRYKGQHSKETRIFKAQVRFDLDMFIDTISLLLSDTSNFINNSLEKKNKEKEILKGIADRFAEIAKRLINEKEAVEYSREREMGKGIFIEAGGKVITEQELKGHAKEFYDLVNKITEERETREKGISTSKLLKNEEDKKDVKN